MRRAKSAKRSRQKGLENCRALNGLAITALASFLAVTTFPDEGPTVALFGQRGEPAPAPIASPLIKDQGEAIVAINQDGPVGARSMHDLGSRRVDASTGATTPETGCLGPATITVDGEIKEDVRPATNRDDGHDGAN